MVRRGKGWNLVGFSSNEAVAKAKAAELQPKGFETSINAATKTFRSRQTGKTFDKTVYKVWAKDTMNWRYSYKKNGEGPRRY